jgi:hypothetical protein
VQGAIWPGALAAYQECLDIAREFAAQDQGNADPGGGHSILGL